MYITAAGVVVEREAPRQPKAKPGPMAPDRPDAPKMRAYPDELDDVAPVRFVVCPVCGGNRKRYADGGSEDRQCTVCDGQGQIGGAA